MVGDLISRLSAEVEQIEAGEFDDDVVTMLKPSLPKAVLAALEPSLPTLASLVEVGKDEEETEAGNEADGDSEEEGALSPSKGSGEGAGKALPKRGAAIDSGVDSSDGGGAADGKSDGASGKAGGTGPGGRSRKPRQPPEPEPPLTETGPCSQAKLTEIWKAVNAHKTAVIFRKPVNRAHAPKYDDIVKVPMDLSEVLQRIERGDITNLSGLRKLLNLICANAMLYNGQGSDYYEYAQGFQSHIAGVLKAALGKVTMTPSEREERRLRRLAALANHTAGSDVDSSESEEEAAPSSPEAPPAAAQQRPGRRSRGGT